MENLQNHQIVKAEQVEREGNQIIFGGISSEGKDIRISMIFYESGILRLRLDPFPEIEGERELPELINEDNFDEITPQLRKLEDIVKISTDELEVLVDLDPWKVKIMDEEGNKLLEEDNEDVPWRGHRPPGLGFSLEQENVSLHTGGDGWHSVQSVYENWKLGPEEHIYGLGEKFTDFDKRGQEIETWTMDPPLVGTERTYKNIPFFMSTNGYGVFINSTCRMTHKIGSETTDRYSLKVEDDVLDWIFIHGPSFKKILDKYTKLTGKPSVPPKWSFGLWMSRCTYEDKDELLDVCTELREKEIPCDVVHLDPSWMKEGHNTDFVWNEENFPNPEEMTEKLHDLNFKLSIWEHPYIPVGTEMFEEGIENDYFVKRANGAPYLVQPFLRENTQAFVDFTNSEAVEWYKEKHRKLFDLGVDVFKTDFGEAIPENSHFDNGLTGKYMHNYYPLLYNKTVFEVTEEEKGYGLVWGRSAFAGSQKFPVNWGGDPRESFRDMANTLKGGLSYGMSGCPFWSHDIGGFTGEPDDELYIRWAQFGLLSSHSRCHGTTPREPWEFDKDALSIFRKFVNLRYRLIPYLYSYANIAAKGGVPVLRPMVLEFGDDPNTYTMDTQYMLGEEVLVAPVFNRSGEKKVYLPKGIWFDFWTGGKFEGPKTLELSVGLDRVPLFIKSDSIVPMSSVRQSVENIGWDKFTLKAYLLDEASFDLYTDEDSFVPIRCLLDNGDVYLECKEEEMEFNFEIKLLNRPKSVFVNGSELSSDEWSYLDEESVLKFSA